MYSKSTNDSNGDGNGRTPLDGLTIKGLNLPISRSRPLLPPLLPLLLRPFHTSLLVPSTITQHLPFSFLLAPCSYHLARHLRLRLRLHLPFFPVPGLAWPGLCCAVTCTRTSSSRLEMSNSPTTDGTAGFNGMDWSNVNLTAVQGNPALMQQITCYLTATSNKYSGDLGTSPTPRNTGEPVPFLS